MTKRTSIAVICTIVAVAAAMVLRSAPASAQSGFEQGSGMQRFAGAYWLVFEAPGLPPLPAIGIINADGTIMLVDGTDEGLGGLTTVNSAALGAIKRTGPHQTTSRTIYLSYDAAGSPVTAVANVAVGEWNADASGGVAVLQQRAYDLLLGEDPTDPAQGTPAGDPIPFTFKRIGV